LDEDLFISAKAAFSDLSTTGERQLRKRPHASQSASAPVKKTPKKTAKTPKVNVLSVHSFCDVGKLLELPHHKKR